MDTFKKRLSNVISWAGFLCLVGGLITGFTGFTGLIGGDGGFFIAWTILGAVGWIMLGVVNYLMCGEFRLIPWTERKLIK